MPSPWVQRALGQAKAVDGSTLRLPPKSLNRYATSGAKAGPGYHGLGQNIRSELSITADERTAAAVRDSQVSVNSGGATADPADSAGLVGALRAFGIVR